MCVFRTYEDFDWLQQNFFSQENVPGLPGVIVSHIVRISIHEACLTSEPSSDCVFPQFPPLPPKALPSLLNTASKSLKQLGMFNFYQSDMKSIFVVVSQLNNSYVYVMLYCVFMLQVSWLSGMIGRVIVKRWSFISSRWRHTQYSANARSWTASLQNQRCLKDTSSMVFIILPQ